MTTFLGLDLSKANTGWCYMDPNDYRNARVGCIKSTGDWESATWDFSGKFIQLIKREGKPDFTVIEMPMRSVQQFRKGGTKMLPDAEADKLTVNPKSALIVNQITGACIAVLRGFGIPFQTVSPATWRAGFFIKGTKPAEGETWKHVARRQCERLGIDVHNMDEAESVGVAFAGPGCDLYRSLKHEGKIK